jgi:hypothetical protein
MNNNAMNQQRYFNLHVNAAGWINGIKMVEGNGQPFFVVEFTALEGNAENPKYHFFSLVMTDAVSELLTAYQGDLDQGAKLFSSLRIANLDTVPFTFQSGERAGEIGVSLRGKIISVQSLTIDGQKIDLGNDDYQSGYQNQSHQGRGNQQGNPKRGHQGNARNGQNPVGQKAGHQGGAQQQNPVSQESGYQAGAQQRGPANQSGGYRDGGSQQRRQTNQNNGFKGGARGPRQTSGYQNH